MLYKLEILQNTCDASITNYFKQAVSNHVVLMRKAIANDKIVVLCEDLCNYEKLRTEITTSTAESSDDLLFDDLKQALTKREADIIYQIYVCGLSIAQIADTYKISKQAVSDIKLKSIKKPCNFFN